MAHQVPPARGRAGGPGAPVGTGPGSRPGFGLRGPRRERHVLTADQLAAVALPIGDDGVVLGLDARREPVVLGLFRPAAHDVVLVGGVWLAQVIALRAAATGARVAVETGRAATWAPLAQAAGGGQPCVTVHRFGRLGPQGPSVNTPVLVLRDLGARPARGRLSAGPWQTTLTLLPYLDPHARSLLATADLVGLQRVSPEEAALAGRSLGLPDRDVTALPAVGDDVALWVRGPHRRFVRSTPVGTETRLLGPARRVD